MRGKKQRKAAYRKKKRETENLGKTKTRIKLLYVNECVCDRRCFTTVKKEQQQEYNRDENKKKEKKRTTSKIGNTKRTKNMSTSLENQRDRDKQRKKVSCIA
jgi:hypothetical protein